MQHRAIRIIAIVFAIVSGSLVHAQSSKLNINIENIDSLNKEQLLQSMDVYRYRDYGQLTDALIQRLIKDGVGDLKTALQTLGYYHTEITHTEQNQNGTWNITYTVNLGKPIIVKDANISITGEGADDTALDKWKADYPLKAGEIMDQVKYENAKSELLRILYNRGYFNYQLSSHKILIDPETNSATIDLVIDTETRFRFGAVSFTQKKAVFNQDYLEKFVAFNTGDPFLISNLTDTQQHLSGSDEFQTIEVQPLLNQKNNGEIPVQISLDAKKPLKIEYGLGYGTDTGPRASANIERRQLTREGHRADLNIQASKILSSLRVGYTVPLAKPYSDFFTVSAERDIENTDTVTSQKNTISFDKKVMLSHWSRTAFLNYETEHSEIGTQITDSILLIPGIRFSSVQKDIPSRVTTSWRANAYLKGATDKIVSDATFVQALFDGWLQYPFSYQARIITHAQIGRTWTSTFDKLPASQRFFTGGDFSVRGYAYDSLGPEDINGEVIGGENLLVGSIEFQHQIKGNLLGSIFYDTGNAYNDNNISLKSGVGFGIGWTFPFATINLYRAEAISLPDRPWRFHLTIGSPL